MLKRLMAAVIILGMSVQAFGASQWKETEDFDVSAKGCVVMEASTGRVLYAKNPDKKLPMASTTKIMTTILTLEQPQLDDYFTVDTTAIHVEGSSMGLLEGDKVTLRGLCYGMLLPSGNDAAGAAAVKIAGSKEQFAQLMNRRAEEWGMTNTHFVTPSGLDDDQHYSTAYDMAVLTAHALENPTFLEICSQYKASLEFGNPPYKRWLQNHNKLLQRYEFAIGVKTGFTDSAGRCLVSAAEKNGVRLICVTLGASDDWNIHETMYERYFAGFTPTDLTEQAEGFSLPVTGGTAQSVQVAPVGKGEIPLYGGESGSVECAVELPPFLYAPIEKGQTVGTAVYKVGDKVVKELPLVAQNTVEAVKKETFFSKIKALFERDK